MASDTLPRKAVVAARALHQGDNQNAWQLRVLQGMNHMNDLSFSKRTPLLHQQHSGPVNCNKACWVVPASVEIPCAIERANINDLGQEEQPD